MRDAGNYYYPNMPPNYNMYQPAGAYPMMNPNPYYYPPYYPSYNSNIRISINFRIEPL